MYYLIRITLFSWLMLGMVARIQAQYGDCATAFRLCSNNQAYTFPTMLDGGKAVEIPVSDCYPAGIPERHSLWLELEAAAGGTLLFDLRPLHAGDDLDFVVYEATGPGCGQQRLLRCAATGSEYGEEKVDECVGVTGLRLGDGDVQESAGCRSESNGYLEALTLKAGQRYWVQVLNYHGWHGFELALSGSAVLKKEYALRRDESGLQDGQWLGHQTSSTETVSKAGNAHTQISSIGGCSVLLLEERELKGRVLEMLLFPNPASEAVTLWIEKQSTAPSGNYVIRLLDARGQTVLQKMLDIGQEPLHESHLSLQGLSSGFYQVLLTDQGGNPLAEQKLIKQ